MGNPRQTENAFHRAGDFALGICGAFAALFLDFASSRPVAPRRSAARVQVKEGAATVLAVDDDELYLCTISELLRQDGMRVFASKSPADAVDLLRYKGGEIDVVLLDYEMPSPNGEATLRHVRKICPDIKVIAITGVEVQKVPVSFREEVDDFLEKPFTSSDLIGCIQTLLHRRQGNAPASTAASSAVGARSRF